MMPDYEIVLGQGIGTIIFGMTKKEFTGFLGDPDDIEASDDSSEETLESYRYNSINCSFLFDPGQDDRLAGISVENGYFHIYHKIRVGLRKNDLLNLGAELKLGDPLFDEVNDEEYPSRELISYDRVGLKLWLDDGKLTVIRIYPVTG